MKLTRRSIRPVAVGVLAAIGLAACGGSDAAPTTQATVASTTAAPTTAAPATTAATTAPTTAAPATTAATTAAPATPAPTPAPTKAATTAPANNANADRMSMEEIAAAVDPRGESQSVDVLTWGDADGDGDEDAIVNTVFCGASCGFSLDLVFDEGGSALVASYAGPEPFAPWVVGAGAGQSTITSATIDGSTIILVGTGLCSDLPISETDEPGSCNFTTERTATYEYRAEEIRSVSIDPEPG